MPVAGRHRGLHSPPVGRNEPARVRDVQLLGKAAKNPVPLGIEIFCGLSGGPVRRPGITENLDRRSHCVLIAANCALQESALTGRRGWPEGLFLGLTGRWN